MSHIIKLPKPTELNLYNYIDYLVENELPKSDMYEYIAINGKSDIVKLEYMFSDVENILFAREYEFMEEQEEYINRRIKEMEENGQELPILRNWSLDERLEYIKSRPSFQQCDEQQKEKRIKWATEHHIDITIDRKKLAGYDWEYHSVREFSDMIKDEIERLKRQTTSKISTLSIQKIDKNNTVELFAKNLTDFLEEIRLDLKENKYKFKYAGGQMSDSDMQLFMKRITSDFDLESIKLVHTDIKRWEFEVEETIVTKKLKNILADSAYSVSFDNTKEKLRANKNFRDKDIELFKRELLFLDNDIMCSVIDGYFDALNDTSTPDHSTDAQNSDTIPLPNEILQWLSETTCANGKTYIETPTEKPLKWLQSKQLARELLTHPNIKGSLKVADVERQAPTLFIDENNNPLTLAKNKKVPSTDSDNLSDFLATLQTSE